MSCEPNKGELNTTSCLWCCGPAAVGPQRLNEGWWSACTVVQRIVLALLVGVCCGVLGLLPVGAMACMAFLLDRSTLCAVPCLYVCVFAVLLPRTCFKYTWCMPRWQCIWCFDLIVSVAGPLLQ